MKLFGTAFLAALVVGAAGAQQTQGITHKDIWEPNRHIKDQNITLAPWGSGSIGETDETAADGAFSIRVSTHNYFQGGTLKLGNPVNLASSYSDPNSLLEFTIRTADNLVIGGPAGGGGGKPGLGGGFGGGEQEGGGGLPPSGAPHGGGLPPSGGGAPQFGSGQAGQGGFGGFGRGFGGRKGGGAQGQPGQGAPAAQTAPAPTLNMVRVIISTSDGKKSEAYLPLPPTAANQPWKHVAIPLEKINGFDKTNKDVVGISFSGDATSTYYVGDIRVVNDPTPITGHLNATDPLNLALGDTVEFIGYGDGGSSILKYEWCFDNSTNATDPSQINIDAIGQAIKHKFRKPGKFTVTLVIADYYGLKKPYVTSIPVTVNP